MKFRRFLSGLLFGLGCALIFIGILTTVLPSVPNQQLQLVLGSFSLSSDNAIVQLINRAMSFALEKNWRVLVLGILTAAAGAWLLLSFTPKKQKTQPKENEKPRPVQPPAVSEPENDIAPKVPNPFAVATYLDHLPLREARTDVSFIRHAAPILEPNRIEEAALPVLPVEDASFQMDEKNVQIPEPYFSNRLETESRAIEAERAIPSQSGSSMLIRSTYDEPSVSKAASLPTIESTLTEEVPARPPAPVSTPSAMPPFSPRIRSTMGRKSSRA